MENLNLNENLKKALVTKGFTSLTTVQSEAIPKILEGKDLIIESKTGSGKTLAFLLPFFENIDLTQKAIQGLVIAPTQELASQIYNESNLLSTQSGIPVTAALLIGGANINNQVKKLKEKPNLVIGTPKRILELIKLKKLPCHMIKTLVFDEADHTLDKGNFKVTSLIRRATLRDTQVIAFSATIDEGTISRALSIMSSGEVIKLSTDTLSSNVEHIIVECERRDKYEMTNKVLNAIEGKKAIIFTNSQNDINLLKETLDFHKKKSIVLSGDKQKMDRRDTITKFKTSNDIDILISSDLGARGLHVEGLTHVLNLDYPLNSNEYVHRAGRAGRDGSFGLSICIATKRDLSFINNYKKDLNIEFKEMKLVNGLLQG